MAAGRRMSRRRTFPWLLCTALAPLLMAGSCQPDLQEIATFPALACPGDTVQLRLIAKNYEGGRFTATFPPVTPAFPISFGGSEALRAEERSVTVCTSTTFRAAIWNGEEAACREGLTVCDETSVSVMTGDETFTRTAAACGGSAPGEATLGIPSLRFSESAQIRDVRNCGSRAVTLSHGGTTDRLDPEGSSGAFSGQSWTGDWVAVESVVPPEACPPPDELVPRPPPTPPPVICLAFTVGCPDTTACG